MTFAVTPTGIRAYIPIFTWRGEIFADLHWSRGGAGRVFLHLEHDPDSPASSSHRPSYRVSDDRLAVSGGLYTEYADICLPDGPPSWKEVLIKHRPLLLLAPGQLSSTNTERVFIPPNPMQLMFDAPFRFPEAHIKRFLAGSWSSRLEIRGAELHCSWTAGSNPPTTFIFTLAHDLISFILIRVGQCQQEGPSGEQRGHQALWATASAYLWSRTDRAEWIRKAKISEVSTETIHDCSQDHVLQWPDLRKSFDLEHEYYTLEVTLSFTPCPLNPERTLILNASSDTRFS